VNPLCQLIEAALFAAPRPVTAEELQQLDPDASHAEVRAALEQLREHYEFDGHGVQLDEVAGGFQILSRPAFAAAIERAQLNVRAPKLSAAMLETLAVIAYRQPVGRAEIEEIRGVTTSKGSVDVLLETGWIRPRGRRKSPGRPVTYGTSEPFLSHFGLDAVGDLPGLEELKGSGLLDGRLPPGFSVPMPSDDPALHDDEDPLEPGDLDLGLAPPPERTGEE